MFHDGRGRRVVFIAHCLLNQNSISDGTAVRPAGFKELIDFFLDAGVGVVQMPCPEFACLGLDRGNVHGADSPVVVENTRIRAELKKAVPNEKLDGLVRDVLRQITEYHKYGFEIVGIIGANRSPTCGVETTSDRDMEIAGMGVFMEKLSDELMKRGLSVPMMGIKADDDLTGKLRRLL